MIDIDSSILFQAANFLLMWFILNQLLFKPIRGIIKKRGEVMAGQLEAINGFTSDATKKIADYEAGLAQARAAGMSTREQMKAQAQAAEQELLGAAQQEASAKLGAARGEIAAQAKAASDSLKGQVRAMAEKATAKILG